MMYAFSSSMKCHATWSRECCLWSGWSQIGHIDPRGVFDEEAPLRLEVKVKEKIKVNLHNIKKVVLYSKPDGMGGSNYLRIDNNSN